MHALSPGGHKMGTEFLSHYGVNICFCDTECFARLLLSRAQMANHRKRQNNIKTCKYELVKKNEVHTSALQV